MGMSQDDTEALAKRVLEACQDRGLMLATAESCTGGLIASALTAIAGSSSVVERGFVTYTNEAKNQMLGVPLPLFETVGAVSEEVARAMAEGALENAPVQVAVSVSGIAGPGGATPGKPVGLVHMAVALEGGITLHARQEFNGNRDSVREQAVDAALGLVLELLEA